MWVHYTSINILTFINFSLTYQTSIVKIATKHLDLSKPLPHITRVTNGCFGKCWARFTQEVSTGSIFSFVVYNN
jgi:hypothetical protein